MDLASIKSTSVVRRASNLLFKRFDDEFMAIDGQAGYCYSLNEAAKGVWDIIDSPMRIDDVCVKLRAEYAVDEATCEQDVIELCEALRGAGLIEAVDGA